MPEQQPESPISRRDLLMSVIAKVGEFGAATLFGAGAAHYCSKFYTSLDPDSYVSAKKAMPFDAFEFSSLVKVPMELSFGAKNLVANPNVYTDGPSEYMKRSSAIMQSYLISAFPDVEYERINDYQSKPYSKTGNLINLGGPFANQDAAEFLRYDFGLADRRYPHLPCVKAGNDFFLPFEFLNGETTRGEFGGKTYKALSYVNGEVSEKPVWKIKDRRINQIKECVVEDGWLASDYLQIIRLKSRSGTKIFIWGLYDDCLPEFLRWDKFGKNLSELHKRTRRMDEFHALLPVHLQKTEAVDGPYMQVSVDWKAVDNNKYVVELKY